MKESPRERKSARKKVREGLTDFRLGAVDKIEYRDAANTLVGTDDFTYNDLLQRTSGTGRMG